MMRRNILLIACLTILVSLFLVGCGEEETTTTTAAAPAESTTTSAAAPTESTTATTTGETTPPAAEATVIKLKMATEKPPTHLDMTDNFPGYFELVEAATNGKYKFEIEYFPVNTILAPPDIYDGVVKGIVDVGQSSMGYTTRRFPVMVTLSQPGIAPPKNTTAMAAAANEMYAQLKPEELADTHVLYLYASGPGWIHTNTALENVEQLDGQRIRVSGTGVRGVELTGGDPVAMPMADVYEAAQKGTIDALISPAETLEGWKHAELFDFSSFVPYMYASDIFFVTMNQTVWDGLPDDLKAAMESVTMDAGLRGGAIWDYASLSGIEFAEGMGHTFITLSDAETAELLNVLGPVKQEYTTFLNDAGLPGEEIVAKAASFVEEANKVEYELWQPE